MRANGGYRYDLDTISRNGFGPYEVSDPISRRPIGHLSFSACRRGSRAVVAGSLAVTSATPEAGQDRAPPSRGPPALVRPALISRSPACASVASLAAPQPRVLTGAGRAPAAARTTNTPGGAPAQPAARGFDRSARRAVRIAGLPASAGPIAAAASASCGHSFVVLVSRSPSD
eukprot:scaffold1135_cov343-Prasinococcus_capsulatus_cf.AAC.13